MPTSAPAEELQGVDAPPRHVGTPCSAACKDGDPAVHHVVTDVRNAYDVVLPSLVQWALYGVIPNPLLNLAQKIEYGELEDKRPTANELKDYEELKDLTVSKMVVPEIPIELVQGYADGQRLSGAIPREDRDNLWATALRLRPVDAAEQTILEQYEKFRDVLNRAAVAEDMQQQGSGPGGRAGRR